MFETLSRGVPASSLIKRGLELIHYKDLTDSLNPNAGTLHRRMRVAGCGELERLGFTKVTKSPPKQNKLRYHAVSTGL